MRTHSHLERDKRNWAKRLKNVPNSEAVYPLRKLLTIPVLFFLQGICPCCWYPFSLHGNAQKKWKSRLNYDPVIYFFPLSPNYMYNSVMLSGEKKNYYPSETKM
ncbi:hypothetical protein CDAR_607881 [Caerostris darwini]|uniref:Uncharacterized protein n=1 Tax=Caerostris darwini TaxID=1538125 RepID=A0AAV4UL63_9ARAC|nr:hypothetical protein CDAR_607881 [Caerostris darwini]